MLIVTLTHSDYVSFTVESLFSSFPPLPPSFLPPPPHLTQAALMGGTTMVMALVLPEQHCSLLDAYENCRALADANAVLHEVGQHTCSVGTLDIFYESTCLIQPLALMYVLGHMLHLSSISKSSC